MIKNELILFPILKARHSSDGSLIMTQKFFEGVALFNKYWPGKVSVLADIDERPTTDMDHTVFKHKDWEFDLSICPKEVQKLAHRLRNAVAALGVLSGRNLAILEACNLSNVPLICTSEYTPKTERQIAATELVNRPLRHARRLLWLYAEERRRKRLLPQIAGLQCSGTPTYEIYKSYVPGKALLFFDNRVLEKDILPAEQFNIRVKKIFSGKPIQLVFGGRLISMKGVSDLPKVAKSLREQNIDFKLSIVGSGPLEDRLRSDIRANRLEEYITMLPPMDFRNEWVPFLKENADLFLCTHVQGDPSSTYPEVMSCGLPIVGYDNEAFKGVVAHSNAGWTVPLNRFDKMAEMVAHLDRNREEILRKGRNAVTFAAEHAFEKTFERRAAHLRDLSNLRQG